MSEKDIDFIKENSLNNIEELSPLFLNKDIVSYSDFKNYYTRHDRNIASNAPDFIDTYEERGKLCLNLVLYFQWQYSNEYTDLLGYYNFNIENFCKIFTYRKENLLRKLKDEEEIYYYKINKNKKGDAMERFVCTVLGDAFYRLRYKELNYSNKATFYDMKTFNVENYDAPTIFIRQLMVAYEKKSNYTKLLVKYQIEEMSLINNVKNFSFADLESYSSLRESNNDILYLYITYIINNLKNRPEKDFTNRWEVNIKVLKKYCGIEGYNQTRNIDQQKELYKAISKKLKLVQSKIKEKFSFSKNRYDYSYTIVFDELKPMKNEDAINLDVSNAFKTLLEKELHSTWLKYQMAVGEKMPFIIWKKKDDIDREAKLHCYITAQKIIYNKSLSLEETKRITLISRKLQNE